MSDDLIKRHLLKADDFLLDAFENFAIERYLACVNRVYYAIFTSTQALFLRKDILTKSHKGTISQFNEKYIKTQKIDKRYAIILADAFDKRQDADYDLDAKFNKEEVLELITNAKDFIEMVKEYLFGS